MRTAPPTADRGPDLCVRSLAGHDDLRAAAELFGRVWHHPRGLLPVDDHVLAALALSGNYVAGAFDGDGVMVGASAGWATPPPACELHSHITGVAPGLVATGIGTAMKLHQRAWALERSISVVTWTFDPLVRRNTVFNLSRLGATATAYLENLYGEMDDELNAGEPSDRLLARWELDRESVRRAVAGERQIVTSDLPVVLRCAGDEPVRAAGQLGSEGFRIELPADIESLRREALPVATRWRAAVREVLAPALRAGLVVAGVDAGHRLVVCPPAAAGSEKG